MSLGILCYALRRFITIQKELTYLLFFLKLYKCFEELKEKLMSMNGDCE